MQSGHARAVRSGQGLPRLFQRVFYTERHTVFVEFLRGIAELDGCDPELIVQTGIAEE